MARPYTDLSDRALQAPGRRKRRPQPDLDPPDAPDDRRRASAVWHNAMDSRGGSGDPTGRPAPHRPGWRTLPAPGAPSRLVAHAATAQEAKPDRMLRLLHTADVHLGARHTDL